MLIAVCEQILDAIALAEEASSGLSLDQFRLDRIRRAAVQRAIEIISEASRRLPPDLTAAHPDIPCAAVFSIGNILRHEYHRISDDIVWRVVIRDLPPLKAAVEQMRKQHEA